MPHRARLGVKSFMAPRLAAGIVVWAVLLASAPPAVALSCVAVPLAKVAAEAGATFEATVVSVQPHPAVRTADGLVSASSGGRPVTVTVGDVRPIRGASPVTLESVDHVLEEGRRYLIIAISSRARPGVWYVGACAGYVRPAARSTAFRQWLASLTDTPSGGRVLGAVVQRSDGDDISTWPSVAGARVTARGPVVATTTSDHEGEYVLTGLPDGEYDVSVELPEGRHGLVAPAPFKARLSGAHAITAWDVRVEVAGRVSGVVVDDTRQPVAGASVYLNVVQDGFVIDDGPYWRGTSAADGRYAFEGVPPGQYVATIGRPYAPTHARAQLGGDTVVLGFADAVELQPLVAVAGETILVDGTVRGRDGRPLETEFHVEVVGPFGLYPRSGSWEVTNKDGRFRLRLLRGVRHRFTTVDKDGRERLVFDAVADGTPVHLVEP